MSKAVKYNTCNKVSQEISKARTEKTVSAQPLELRYAKEDTTFTSFSRKILFIEQKYYRIDLKRGILHTQQIKQKTAFENAFGVSLKMHFPGFQLLLWSYTCCFPKVFNRTPTSEKAAS